MLEENSKIKENEYIDFSELSSLIWKSKYLYLSVFLISYIFGSIYVNSLTPIYKSSALVKPADSSSISSSNSSQINILANIIGGRGSAEINKTSLALEMLTSRSFFNSFYENDELMTDLIAFEKYSSGKKSDSYRKNLLDEFNLLKTKPSIDSSHGRFLSHLEFTRDEVGLITITINHPSPLIAYKWNVWLFNALDQYIRDREKLKAEKSVVFLENKINEVRNIELQRGLSNMIQSQLGTLLLAEVSDNFVFEIIDDPFIASSPHKPNKSFIKNVIVFGSIFLLTFLILTLYYFNKIISFSILPLSLKIEDYKK